MKKLPNVRPQTMPIVLPRTEDNIDRIQAIVSRITGVPLASIVAKGRGRQRITDARLLSMYFCEAYEVASQPDIAPRHGRLDHTSVGYACKQVGRMKSLDRVFARTYLQCEREVKELFPPIVAEAVTVPAPSAAVSSPKVLLRLEKISQSFNRVLKSELAKPHSHPLV